MGGLGQGFVQGYNQAQDRIMLSQQLKLEKDYAASRQKAMETEDQLKQIQIQSFMKRVEAEQRLPSQQAALLGPQGAPLGEGQQGPGVPEPAPEIDRRKLAMFLQSAADAGQDPNQLMQFMAMADPRMKAIADSLQPEHVTVVPEGGKAFATSGPRRGQVIAEGAPKQHKPDIAIEKVTNPDNTISFVAIDKSKIGEGQTVEPQQIGNYPGPAQKPNWDFKEVPGPEGKGKRIIGIDKNQPNPVPQELASYPGPADKPNIQIVEVPDGTGGKILLAINKDELQSGTTEVGKFPGAPQKPSYDIQEVTMPDGTRKLMAINKANPQDIQEVQNIGQAPEKPQVMQVPGATGTNIVSVQPRSGAITTLGTFPGGEGAPKPVSDENRHALATFGMPYMSLNAKQQGIVNQKILDDKELIAGALAGAGAKARREEKKQEVLPPAQAAELGVPYGTTQEEAKGVMPITAQHRDALNAYDTARTIIHDIEQYSEKVNTAASGLIGRAEQSMKLWGAWTQSDPNAALLMSKAGELASVARSLGEKGALANQDVARAAALVPGVMDTRDVAVKKIQDMKAIIDKGEANFRKNLGINARQAPPEKPLRKEKEDPYAGIEVPPNLSPKQQKIYKENYLKQREETRKKMQGGTNAPQPQR